MKNLYRFGGLLAALLISASVYAGDIQVEKAWARASAPGQDTGSVDLTLTSKQAATLIGATSTACQSVQLHSMTMAQDTGMMQMREVDKIDLPAGKAINLGSSGYHLMLIGLKSPLKAGDSVPLKLNFKVGGRTENIEASAKVMPLNTTEPMDGKPMDGMAPGGY